MVEKGLDYFLDKFLFMLEQGVQCSCFFQFGWSGGKNFKKSQSWYNVLSFIYKQRNEDFRKFFKQFLDMECFIVDYLCVF